jgi:hypothetical protein
MMHKLCCWPHNACSVTGSRAQRARNRGSAGGAPAGKSAAFGGIRDRGQTQLSAAD